MANVVMLFMGDMESPGHSIKCHATDSNVFIDIDTSSNGDRGSYISLDIPTAVKFIRELKKQVAISKYISEHIPE